MKCSYCDIEIQNHPANECLNRLYAEKVMGWFLRKRGNSWWDKQHNWKYDVLGFKPSTNIAHAMEGVQKAKDAGLHEFGRFVAVFSESVGGKYDENPNTAWFLFNFTSFNLTRALVMWAMEQEK